MKKGLANSLACLDLSAHKTQAFIELRYISMAIITLLYFPV